MGRKPQVVKYMFNNLKVFAIEGEGFLSGHIHTHTELFHENFHFSTRLKVKTLEFLEQEKILVGKAPTETMVPRTPEKTSTTAARFLAVGEVT